MTKLIRMLIVMYRLVPARVRSHYPGQGSSSHLALAAIDAGGSGIAAVWRYFLGPVARSRLGVNDGPFWEPERSRIPDDPWSVS